MQRLLCRILAAGSLLLGATFAETPVPPNQRYERIIAVVPMVGSGTYADPKRPLFAPRTPDPKGIFAFSYEVTDDGQFAIVEFVSRSAAALKAVVTDKRIAKSFERTKHKQDEVEAELKKLKKDFDLNKFGVSVQ